jgi:hypothetical protein
MHRGAAEKERKKGAFSYPVNMIEYRKKRLPDGKYLWL